MRYVLKVDGLEMTYHSKELAESAKKEVEKDFKSVSIYPEPAHDTKKRYFENLHKLADNPGLINNVLKELNK